MKGLRTFIGFLAGAILGALLVVLYDTSSQTSTLEGGRGHLTFGAGVGATVAGAIIGGTYGWLTEQVERRRRK